MNFFLKCQVSLRDLQVKDAHSKIFRSAFLGIQRFQSVAAKPRRARQRISQVNYLARARKPTWILHRHRHRHRIRHRHRHRHLLHFHLHHLRHFHLLLRHRHLYLLHFHLHHLLRLRHRHLCLFHHFLLCPRHRRQIHLLRRQNRQRIQYQLQVNGLIYFIFIYFIATHRYIKSANKQIQLIRASRYVKSLRKKTFGAIAMSLQLRLCANATVNRIFRFTELDDICQLMKGMLCSDICVPTPGSYYCKCRDGFTLLEDGKTCRQNLPIDRQRIYHILQILQVLFLFYLARKMRE